MLYSNSFIQNLATHSNQQPVLIQDGQAHFAADILKQSQRLAVELAAQGMRENDRAVIAAEPGLNFLYIIYATMLLRVQLAIIDPEMGRENYRAKLDQFNPQWAFVDSRLLLLQEHPILRFLYLKFSKHPVYFPCRKGLKTIAVGQRLPLFQRHLSLAKLLKKQSAALPSPLQTESPNLAAFEYLLIYTSGTVSEPKGVLHTFSALQTSINLLGNIIRSDRPQRVATHLPHFMLIGVSANVQVHLWDDKMSIARKIRFIEQHQITTLFSPPADYLDLIDYCQQQQRKLPDCLQHVLIGSAPVHIPFLEKLVQYLPITTKVTCLYGMTENLLVATTDGREKINYAGRGDLLGQPVVGVEIEIANDGEVLLRSPQLFSRYFHAVDRPEWHATGDLGYLDNKENLVLTGRKKEMIIRRNFNLYPALYEPTIKKIPGVREAVFIGKYDETIADERVILVIETEKPLTTTAVMDHLKTGKYSIDQKALPDKIIFRKIPRHGRQRKVDRRAIVLGER